MRYELKYLAGAVIILLAGLFIFQHLLFPADPDQIYPWDSDTAGHLVKAVYLQKQIAQGVVYPDTFPGWYNGIQLLRYHAPLPYYLLVGLSKLTPNIWWAGNVFLVLSSLGGGLSLLLYRRWLGLLPAIGAGALFMALPDNLRIAFAEGNLPRALAIALLPITFYFFLRPTVFEGRRWQFAAVVVGVGLVVLSHAMMAAIFIVGCGLFAVLSGLVRAASFKSASRGVLALITGTFLSGGGC